MERFRVPGFGKSRKKLPIVQFFQSIPIPSTILILLTMPDRLSLQPIGSLTSQLIVTVSLQDRLRLSMDSYQQERISMSWHKLLPGLVVLAMLQWMIGCQPQQPMYLFEDGDLSHYIDKATEIEYPDIEVCTLPDAKDALPPLTLRNSKPTEIWDLELQEAIHIALENSRIMRSLGGVAFGATGTQGDPSTVLSNPNAVTTVYDPALVQSDPRYGEEAALAAFDGQLSAGAFWQKNDLPQNANTAFAALRPTVLQSDVGTFQAQIAKTAATGGTFSLRSESGYDWSNAFGSRRWPSNWTTFLQGTFSQPLLQGRGVQFNRIAGPGAIPGFSNGIMIARLKTDTALNDFEMGVRQLVYDVERAYWNLYYGYRRLQSVKAGRDAALQTWQQTYAMYQAGHKRGSAQNEAQSRQQYFLFRGQVEAAQSNLFKTESILRYIMGIGATDGRLIRPSDEPTVARVDFDWNETLAEALVRSVELRKQKWAIKQRQLELIAQKNFLQPRLDASGTYRWRGLGQWLIDPPNHHSNAFSSMTSGRYQEWELGLDFSMPLGFRKELSAVQNAKMALARERAILQEQELELSHQIASAKRDLDEYYKLSETHFNRRHAAQIEVSAVQASYDADITTLNQVLDAQRRLAEAEIEYYRSVIDYNLAIANIHFRKSSLLEYNGIRLAEGPWPGKAYFDATRRARARDAGTYMNYGFTRPKVISRGAYQQHQNSQFFPSTENTPIPKGLLETPTEMKGVPSKESFEEIRTPEGQPAQPPQPQVAPPAGKSTMRSGVPSENTSRKNDLFGKSGQHQTSRNVAPAASVAPPRARPTKAPPLRPASYRQRASSVQGFATTNQIR